MAGPIQTAIGQALGAAMGFAAIGRKISEHEGQIAKETADEAAKAEQDQKAAAEADAEKKAKELKLKKEKKEQKKAEKQEAQDVATEADIINFGASPEAAKAYLLAQKRGIAAPQRMIFDNAGKPMATYSEMAQLLADESLSDTYSSQLRTKKAVQVRKQLLEGKSHKERVESAVLAAGGRIHG